MRQSPVNKYTAMSFIWFAVATTGLFDGGSGYVAGVAFFALIATLVLAAISTDD